MVPQNVLVERLENRLRELVAAALQLQAPNVDMQMGLISLGVDSMDAMRIRNQLEEELGVTLSVQSMLSNMSLSELSAEAAAGAAADSAVTGS